jgi:hypothetical protein
MGGRGGRQGTIIVRLLKERKEEGVKRKKGIVRQENGLVLTLAWNNMGFLAAFTNFS